MLKLSKDRKVSPRSRLTKKEAKPLIPNSFGLPAKDSCPGQTEFCDTCYANKIQKIWTNVDKLVWHNFEMLQSAGANVAKMVVMLDTMIKSINWRDEPQLFRWHWNGDVFSKPYAIAIAETCRLNPEVQFLIYTRSFDWVGQLMEVPNLVVYISVDKGNLRQALKVFKKFPQVMVAACDDTWEGGEEIMREMVGRNAPKCPELTRKIPLVNADGVGACVACGMCFYGRNHVRFANER